LFEQQKRSYPSSADFWQFERYNDSFELATLDMLSIYAFETTHWFWTIWNLFRAKFPNFRQRFLKSKLEEFSLFIWKHSFVLNMKGGYWGEGRSLPLTEIILVRYEAIYSFVQMLSICPMTPDKFFVRQDCLTYGILGPIEIICKGTPLFQS